MTKRSINIGILLLALLIGIGIGILGITKASGLLAEAEFGVGHTAVLGSLSHVTRAADFRLADLALDARGLDLTPDGVALNDQSLDAASLLDRLPQELFS